MVIVCFGLNDVNGTLESYINSLETIFSRLTQSGVEVIFMTPNMLNTYVADETEDYLVEYATITAEYQNSGKMDSFMNSAVELANRMGIAVCDCYSKWKKLSETEDTTKLLANHINHPIKEMHELFAQSLFELLFGEENKDAVANDSTMYRK